jgi:hypothetical protein
MARQLDQLTIRGMDERVQKEIRALAKRDGISLNKAALRLLEKGAGIDRAANANADRIGNSLDWFIGSATQEETDELNDSLRGVFDQIDDEMWK